MSELVGSGFDGPKGRLIMRSMAICEKSHSCYVVEHGGIRQISFV